MDTWNSSKSIQLILSYRAESHGKTWSFDLKLFKPVKLEESKWNTKGRNIILNISKANKEEDHWPRLTEEKTKNPHI